MPFQGTWIYSTGNTIAFLFGLCVCVCERYIERSRIWVGDSMTRGLPPGSSAGKKSACNAGDLGLIPGLGRSP